MEGVEEHGGDGERDQGEHHEGGGPQNTALQYTMSVIIGLPIFHQGIYFQATENRTTILCTG